MKRSAVNESLSAEQLKERKRRVSFLILMILNGAAAILVLNFLNFPAPGTLSHVLLACICAVLVVTFLISGIGLLANLFHWMGEE